MVSLPSPAAMTSRRSVPVDRVGPGVAHDRGPEASAGGGRGIGGSHRGSRRDDEARHEQAERECSGRDETHVGPPEIVVPPLMSVPPGRQTSSRPQTSSGCLLGDRLRSVREQALEARLVEDREAELLGLVGLGAGVVADHDVVGLLGDRPGRLAAAHDDRLLDGVARVGLERAGHHDGEPLQGARHGLVALVGHRHAGGLPGVDDRVVPARVVADLVGLGVPRAAAVEPLPDGRGDRGPHAVGVGEGLLVGLPDRGHRAEPGGEGASRGRPDVPDRQRDQHPPQRDPGLALVRGWRAAGRRWR